MKKVNRIINSHLSFNVYLIIVLSIFSIIFHIPSANAAYTKATATEEGPSLNDPTLKVEVVFKNDDKLDMPTTSMAFLGPNDILVLEKDKGTVQRIIDGQLQEEPLLQVDVGNEVEWGMLGIAVSKTDSNTFVYLYYTEADGSQILGNRLYRYELIDNKLVNPFLIVDLPATSPNSDAENNHDGGKVLIGPDNNVYLVVGDVGGRTGQAQNNEQGEPLDGSSGILRVTQDGQPVGNGILADSIPMRLYYAYGIRNSFGFDFDPVTGNLWDAENGSDDKDEINLVKPGFNSGWNKVMGFAPKKFNPEKDLVNFEGKGKYYDPQFVWKQTIGPTALKFLDSNKLGTEYENTIFVGDVNNGHLYNFKLNPDRTGLFLDGSLSDHIANTQDEEQSIVFGSGFGVITDIKVGPDGFLYVLGYDGTVFKISKT